ncbi:MAG: four helix bundle protein [Saprospiraceae bacterium]|nr:four helix bundle protein [Saprospiraceae bacterium]
MKNQYLFRSTSIYKKAFQQAMEIFEVSMSFPKEEKFGLTSQIRRSSRSVCANYAEGHRKRRYPAHLIAKLSDCDMENSETLIWLDFAFACNFITKDQYQKLCLQNEEVGRLIGHALKNPEQY